MVKIDRRKVLEDVGTITNAPVSEKSKGYGFITLDDGTTIYCNKDVVRAAKMSGDDIGVAARVRYQKVKADRYIALRVYVLRDANGSDQTIADILAEIDEFVGQIDDRMQTIFDMLEDRGCEVPEIVED
jgi:hypothetical protein